jgi:hypothetical protein
MGRVLPREQLLRQLAAEPAIVKAALAIIEQHVAGHAKPCACMDTAKAVMSRGGFADGGDIDECDSADDPQACRDSREFWNNVKHSGENMLLDWGEGKIRGALNIRPGAAAALQRRAIPVGALGAGVEAAEAGAAGLAGLEGLEGIGALLALL